MLRIPLHTCLRASSNLSARLQAFSMAFHSFSESRLPDVVDAVTTTLIIMAGGSTPLRFTFVRSCRSLSSLWISYRRNWPQRQPTPVQNVCTWQDRWQVVRVQEIFVHNDLEWTEKVIRKFDLDDLWLNSPTLFTMRISLSTSTDRLFACTITLYSGFECAGSTICAADDGFSRYLSISCRNDEKQSILEGNTAIL